MKLVQKTVYFREGDLPLWEAIENKAAWLHEHLSGQLSTNNLQATIEKTKKILDNPRSKPNWCKEHGMEKDFCKGFKHKGSP